MKITPTLNFAGTCREAIQLYAKAFGGDITCLVSYRDAADPDYISRLTEVQKDYIYHGELILDGQRIIMSDHTDIELGTCYSNFLTVVFDTCTQLVVIYGVILVGSR